jgi:hypothetical protein
MEACWAAGAGCEGTEGRALQPSSGRTGRHSGDIQVAVQVCDMRRQSGMKHLLGSTPAKPHSHAPVRPGFWAVGYSKCGAPHCGPLTADRPDKECV